MHLKYACEYTKTLIDFIFICLCACEWDTSTLWNRKWKYIMVTDLINTSDCPSCWVIIWSVLLLTSSGIQWLIHSVPVICPRSWVEVCSCVAVLLFWVLDCRPSSILLLIVPDGFPSSYSGWCSFLWLMIQFLYTLLFLTDSWILEKNILLLFLCTTRFLPSSCLFQCCWSLLIIKRSWVADGHIILGSTEDFTEGRRGIQRKKIVIVCGSELSFLEIKAFFAKWYV